MLGLGRDAGRSLLIAFAVVLGSGFVVGTAASFTSSTSNGANTFSSAALTAPQALTAAAAGNDVNLSWTAGSFGGGTGFGHRVLERSMGVQADPRDGSAAPGTCANSDTFGTAAGRTSAGVTTLTHTGAGVTAAAGSYACYKVDTEYPASPGTAVWFSQNSNPVASSMVGHVVRSVTTVNGGVAGDIDQGDIVTLTFNQAVNIATGPTSTNNQTGTPTTGQDVCVDPSTGTVNIGRTALNTACSSNQAVVVGQLTGTTMSPTNKAPSYHASYTWSDCPVAAQCRKLSVTLGKRYKDTKDITVTGAPAPSFVPTSAAGSLTSATGVVALCTTANTATSTCRPVPTGTV